MGHEPTQYPSPVSTGGMREGQGSEAFVLREYLSQPTPRTNSIRNSAAQGAVLGDVGSGGALPTNWSLGTANGLTYTIVAFGVVNGMDTIDIRVHGVATGLFSNFNLEPGGVIAAVPGQEWCESVYAQILSLVAYPPSNNILAQIDTGYTGGVAGDTNIVLTPNMVRYSATTISPAGTTFAVPRFLFTLVNGQTYDFTIRFGWPQLELGNGASTPIRTTGATITRTTNGAIRMPDLGQAPRIAAITGFGTGAGAGLTGGRGKECDRSQGTVMIVNGPNPGASGTIVMEFAPNTPQAGQYLAFANWASFTYSISGTQLTLNWTATETLRPFATMHATYQWAISQ